MRSKVWVPGIVTALMASVMIFSYAGCGGGGSSSGSSAPPPTPPAQVASPVPSNSAVNVPITQTLSWGTATGAASYDVYLGLTSTGWSVITNTVITSYSPATLTYFTVYYWRIDSKNADGTTAGNVWNFRTVGSIDTTFDGDGVVTHTNAAGGNEIDRGYATAMSGTQIVVAGQSANISGTDMALWRYNSDGSLDTTFNGQGWVVYDTDSDVGGAGAEAGYAVAIDGSGRIVVAGVLPGLQSDMAIWRYNPNGTLDTTFDSDGVVTYTPGTSSTPDVAKAVAIDGNGKIVVVGYSRSLFNDNDIFVWRYNADGTLDTTFDSDGVVTYTNSAVVESDDKGINLVISGTQIVVVGETVNAGDNGYNLVVLRLNADGALDTAFSMDGVVTFTNAAGGVPGGNWDSGQAVVVDANGRIVVTGFSRNAANKEHMVVWRFNPDGSLDTGFSGDGVITFTATAFGNGVDFGYALVMSGTQIAVAGFSLDQGDGTANLGGMAIWLYNPDGSIDTSFNGQGWVVTDEYAAPGSEVSRGFGAFIDGGGRIVVAGSAPGADGWPDMAIWRFR